MEHIDIPPGEIHAPHNWEFADEAARTAAVISDATLINKWALQIDTGKYWRLSAVSPAAWVAVVPDAAAPTKESIGLGNVDNTADADKPVSVQQQAAIDAAVGGVSAASIGLGNVDNTADADKPVSVQQQAAISAKFDKAGGAITGGVKTKAIALAAFEIDLAAGNYFTKTLSGGGPYTFTLINAPAAGEVCAFALELVGGNSGVVNFNFPAASVTWGGAETAPTLTALRDVIGFVRAGTGKFTGKAIALGAAV